MSINEKDGFMLYKKQYSGISLLSREERGDLLTAIYEYQINRHISVGLSDSTAMAFQFIKTQFDIDAQKYLEKCEKSKRAIESRWNKQDTDEYGRIQTNTKHTDKDKDKDKDKNKGKDLFNPSNEVLNSKEEISKEESRFDVFWQAYPKKIGKAYAKKCFDKLNPSAELTERMVKAIEEQKRSLEWKRDNGQYIPNPSTWLNQGRWDDELRRDPTDHTYTQEEQDRMGEAAMRQMDKWFGEEN